ncbi:MAG: hypothetical protein ACREVE_00895 [Gammaproteobacteria bacterium]
MNDAYSQGSVFPERERDQANAWLVEVMQSMLQGCRDEVDRLQQQLSRDCWIVVWLSIWT